VPRQPVARRLFTRSRIELTVLPDDPEVLMVVGTESEAALIVGALNGEEIKAATEGELTSAMRAEVPGGVRILVLHRDMHRAREVLDEYREGPSQIDWSQADVGGPQFGSSDRCGWCGYNLEGLAAQKCPECGKDLDEVGIGKSHRRSRTFFVVAIVLLVLMLFGLLQIIPGLVAGH